MPPEQPTPAQPQEKRVWTARRIVLAVLLAYGLILVLANRRSVPVNFVFFTTRGSLFVLILLALAVGFLIGWLFDDLRERRRRKSSKPESEPRA
jgi:uncharacterized integral membrane protein